MDEKRAHTTLMAMQGRTYLHKDFGEHEIIKSFRINTIKDSVIIDSDLRRHYHSLSRLQQELNTCYMEITQSEIPENHEYRAVPPAPDESIVNEDRQNHELVPEPINEIVVEKEVEKENDLPIPADETSSKAHTNASTEQEEVLPEITTLEPQSKTTPGKPNIQTPPDKAMLSKIYKYLRTIRGREIMVGGETERIIDHRISGATGLFTITTNRKRYSHKIADFEKEMANYKLLPDKLLPGVPAKPVKLPVKKAAMPDLNLHNAPKSKKLVPSAKNKQAADTPTSQSGKLKLKIYGAIEEIKLSVDGSDRFYLSEPLIKLLKLKLGDYLVLAQNESSPQDWYIGKVAKSTLSIKRNKGLLCFYARRYRLQLLTSRKLNVKMPASFLVDSKSVYHNGIWLHRILKSISPRHQRVA